MAQPPSSTACGTPCTLPRHFAARLPAPCCSDTLWEEYAMAKFIPFNPTDKYTVAFVKVHLPILFMIN